MVSEDLALVFMPNCDIKSVEFRFHFQPNHVTSVTCWSLKIAWIVDLNTHMHTQTHTCILSATIATQSSDVSSLIQHFIDIKKGNKNNGTYLYKLAFIAGGQLLNVTHELILWDRGLFFTRTQQWQGCNEKKMEDAVIAVITHTKS